MNAASDAAQLLSGLPVDVPLPPLRFPLVYFGGFFDCLDQEQAVQRIPSQGDFRIFFKIVKW
jgi:hypothetical protein